MSSRSVGTHFEHQAEAYLKEQGLTLVERNFRLHGGEIDLIMRDQDYWVFVEVKFRYNATVEHPLGQIRQGQLQRIRHCAKVYLYSNDLSEYLTPCRFDVVAITADPAELLWVKDAF